MWNESGSIGRLIALRADPQFWSEEQIRDLSQFILLKAKQYKISPLFIVSLIEVESRFQPSALSPKGAMGLMQVMPATAAFLASGDENLEWRGPEDLNDPKVNIEYGLRYVTRLKSRFQTPEHVLTAYNIGPGALAKKLKNGEEISLSYYQKVMAAMQKYRSAIGGKNAANRGEWPAPTTFAKRSAVVTSPAGTMSDRVINPTPRRGRISSRRKIPWL
jgi:soluble lytic murein transglycosylase-like protein